MHRLKKVFKNNFISLDFKNGFLIVFLSASVMFLIKLIFSSRVYGTNDITYWIYFSKIIQEFGTSKIYSLVKIYNHPPLVSWILKLVRFIEIKSQLSFPFLFRLMPILADYMSIFVIWELLRKYKIKNKILICLICIINPINFLVSGFHGNIDPIFIFLTLLTIYFIENNNIILSGLIYGLSMCVKIVPIILVPVFIFYLKERKDKIIFVLSSSILPVVVFLPYLIIDFHFIIRNIFLYSSLKGIWGLGHILSSIFMNESININIRNFSFLIFKLHIAFGLTIFFILSLILSKFLIENQKLNLTEGAFLTFSLFLVITPGFGVQYLSWLSLYSVIVFPILGMIYVLLGGVFLYRVYIYWGGGLPPYYANSDVVGQWIGFEKILDIVLWLLIIIILIKFVLDKNIFIALRSKKLTYKSANS